MVSFGVQIQYRQNELALRFISLFWFLWSHTFPSCSKPHISPFIVCINLKSVTKLLIEPLFFSGLMKTHHQFVELPQQQSSHWRVRWGRFSPAKHLTKNKSPIGVHTVYFTIRSCPSMRKMLWMQLIVLQCAVLFYLCAVRVFGEQEQEGRQNKVSEHVCHSWKEFIFVGVIVLLHSKEACCFSDKALVCAGKHLALGLHTQKSCYCLHLDLCVFVCSQGIICIWWSHKQPQTGWLRR